MDVGEVTMPLDEFRARYDADDNEWWRTESGHHMNLFDEACEQLDEARTSLASITTERDALREQGEQQQSYVRALEATNERLREAAVAALGGIEDALNDLERGRHYDAEQRLSTRAEWLRATLAPTWAQPEVETGTTDSGTASVGAQVDEKPCPACGGRVDPLGGLGHIGMIPHVPCSACNGSGRVRPRPTEPQGGE